ncbi:MAG: DUF2309 domain-containing protein [Myxococcus sp.]|nr:DUF2309 domain-containing protein [Myxococcus sp.]
MERACALIAPTWPLDRFIAVNPFWARAHTPMPQVASELGALSGARLLMPRAWFACELREGRLTVDDLREALAQRGSSATEQQLLALLHTEEPPVAARSRVVDVMDALPARQLELSWRDFVVQRLSQLCASYFDESQAQRGPVGRGGLYSTWRRHALADHAPDLLMGARGYQATAAALPATAHELIALALAELEVPQEEHERYLQMLLLDLNGWASWCAYRRWTAGLAGQEDDHLVELLAIRLAWDWLLYRLGGRAVQAGWRRAMAGWPAVDRAAQAARPHDWVFQRAAERAWQRALFQRLPDGAAASRPEAPTAQALFCIDVRSEVFRRALEAADARVQTLGFAGFFGLPVDYRPLAAEAARPQLPGLLAPKYRVSDAGAPRSLEPTRRARLQASRAWSAFKSSPLSSFAFVESMGLFFAARLVSDAFSRRARASEHPERSGLTASEDAARAPRLTGRVDGTPLSIEERCQLAHGMLRAMSLTRGFAPLVLLVGHGSQTSNNPHEAGLDCGACCGQTGEVNARAAAALLNEAEVRAGLRARGVALPDTTHFLAALHVTTTDDVVIFDEAAVPEPHRPALAELRATLTRASAAARRERAPKLGVPVLEDAALHAALVDRARDWAQVRPEWGLAGNAALIVAPRERTRHLDLEGRAFLHDYRFEEDPDESILELIMTAPMVVTNWINLQYYASTVDNARYGSGNKVLHNVVGGHLGVFEGNGGDLRIGLPLQSLHDGARWVHAPLRLSVVIEAPREAIDRVLTRHVRVRELVEHEWLHLFQLEGKAVHARRAGGWTEVAR